MKDWTAKENRDYSQMIGRLEREKFERGKTNESERRTHLRATHTFLYRAPQGGRPSITPNRSVYYWWYQYLRRNEDYRRCCESGGQGELAALYEDFGDIYTPTFYQWWFDEHHGERLFAEKPRPVHLEELRTKDEWNEAWSQEDVMVVVVPLTEPKRRINRWFNRILDERIQRRPGKTTKKSDATYQVTGKFSVIALEQMLMVYDYRKEHPDLTMAEIGKKLKLVPSAMPQIGDSIEKLAKKRNTMTATVSRYLKKAEVYIRNTALGKFPCAD